MNRTIITGVGTLSLLYIPKISFYICYIFLRNDHSRTVVGYDLQFWAGDA
jgi:hypothetical protein